LASALPIRRCVGRDLDRRGIGPVSVLGAVVRDPIRTGKWRLRRSQHLPCASPQPSCCSPPQEHWRGRASGGIFLIHSRGPRVRRWSHSESALYHYDALRCSRRHSQRGGTTACQHHDAVAARDLGIDPFQNQPGQIGQIARRGIILTFEAADPPSTRQTENAHHQSQDRQGARKIHGHND
jgi:hypothetical protein